MPMPTDLGVIVNLDTWNGLSDDAKQILQDTAIQHEIDQLRQFIGDSKVVELQKQVEQVEQADAAI